MPPSAAAALVVLSVLVSGFGLLAVGDRWRSKRDIARRTKRALERRPDELRDALLVEALFDAISLRWAIHLAAEGVPALANDEVVLGKLFGAIEDLLRSGLAIAGELVEERGGDPPVVVRVSSWKLSPLAAIERMREEMGSPEDSVWIELTASGRTAAESLLPR